MSLTKTVSVFQEKFETILFLRKKGLWENVSMLANINFHATGFKFVPNVQIRVIVLYAKTVNFVTTYVKTSKKKSARNFSVHLMSVTTAVNVVLHVL